MPSLFDNQYSRGPLYQYWKERGQEEKGLREKRVQEAEARSQGRRPAGPTYGPSSDDAYHRRATAGPPTYAAAAAAVVGGGGGVVPNESSEADLPPYYSATAAPNDHPEGAEEEKTRLHRQRQQVAQDETLAESLSREQTSTPNGDADADDQKVGRSKARKIGTWLADAASGYTKNQGRW